MLSLISGAYVGRNKDFGGRTSVNWFPALSEPGEDLKTKLILVPTSGDSLFCGITGYSVRAMASHEGVGYAVVDTSFYKISQGGEPTLLGTIAYQDIFVPQIIPCQNSQILVTNGSTAYIYDYSTTATFTRVTADQFPGAENGIFQDGYVIIVRNGNMYWSTLGNAAAWSGTDVITPTYSPDKLRTIINNQEQIYLLKDFSTENYYDDGANPFSRRQFSSSHYGIEAPRSAVNFQNRIVWLANNSKGEKIVLACDESGAVAKISTEAIDDWLGKMEGTRSAFAFAYNERGHAFYQLTVPSEDTTLVYDFSTQFWHERKSYLGNKTDGTPRYGRHFANCYMYLGRKHLVGDFASGNIYELDSKAYTEHGNTIRREFTSKTYYFQSKQEKLAYFNVDANTGEVQDNSNPTLMIQTSQNAGRTFGDERWVSLGTQGSYYTRIKLNCVGLSRNWTFKFILTDPVECILGDGDISNTTPSHSWSVPSPAVTSR